MRHPFQSALLLSGLLSAGSLLASVGPVAAQGAPRSMAECERLKNDLAYNQCLAMFGPPARNVGGGDGGAASAPAPVAATATIPGIPAVEEPEMQEGRRGRRSRYSRRSGRVSAAFAIATADDGTGVADSAEAPRSRHRRRRR
ncbi:hypothetical protein [Methylorubrum suomiense]|uniref:Uncharacterized protein n=1 Tax=Methylorubrum suomiense TaxID=144191 RepID=A0ABQ4UVH3_9HYPH|nr:MULTISPECIES: hypothetical protein [Methylobacteriaceae]GJE76291.1 hypothetical protein BGCPKDLD_2883 [Methylorubrum suomiense]